MIDETLPRDLRLALEPHGPVVPDLYHRCVTMSSTQFSNILVICMSAPLCQRDIVKRVLKTMIDSTQFSHLGLAVRAFCYHYPSASDPQRIVDLFAWIASWRCHLVLLTEFRETIDPWLFIISENPDCASFLFRQLMKINRRLNNDILFQEARAIVHYAPRVLTILLETGTDDLTRPGRGPTAYLLRELCQRLVFHLQQRDRQEYGSLYHEYDDPIDADACQTRIDRLIRLAHVSLRAIPTVPLWTDRSSILPRLPRSLRRKIQGPRTLQHVCRCEIRKALYVNRRLPDGLTELPVPRHLLRYLKCE